MVLSKKRITKALIRLRGCAGWSAPMLFANPEDSISRVVAQMAYLFILNCAATCMPNYDEAARRIENKEICRKSQNLFTLKNTQNEIINKNNILKTWRGNFAGPVL